MTNDHDERREVISRRTAFSIAGPIVGMIGLGSLIKLSGRNDAFIRPPGVRSELDFLARCLKCDRCVEVCPEGIVVRVKYSESIASAQTARLDFRLGGCTFCMDCVDVCPSGALTAEEIIKLLGLAIVDHEKCIAWQWGSCTRCFDACPSGAITLDECRRPVVQADLCTGCGLCETACDRSAKRWDTVNAGKAVTIHPLEV